MQQNKASGAQLRMIYGLAKKACLDNDTLHDAAARICRKTSLAELTTLQASRLIDYLQHVNGEDKRVPERASDGQQGMIYAVARDMGWMADPSRLRGFLEKMASVSDVKFLSPAQAGMCIEALKHMRDGGRAERRVSP